MSMCMNPYFMKKATQAKDPLERFKYVITNTISAFYYITMFLKPVSYDLFSSIRLQAKLQKVTTQMVPKSIASRSPIILQLAISLQLVLIIPIDIMDATISQLWLDLTQCLWSTRDIKYTNFPMGIRWMLVLTKKCIQEYSWVV